jgi:hypothetical protein
MLRSKQRNISADGLWQVADGLAARVNSIGYAIGSIFRML